MKSLQLIIALSLLLFANLLHAEPGNEQPEAEDLPADISRSPWIITPLISSNPKLGASAGALVGYMFYFDEKSPVSMVGLAGNYSNTGSYVGGFFSRLYFDENRQRVIALLGLGEINNDYTYERENGQALTLSTKDDFKMAFLRYSHRVYGDWFIGGQYLKTNYVISGGDPASDIILDLLDLVGFESAALGLVASFDSRDNQQSASTGQNFVFHQLAFRENFGGDVSFDAYHLDYNTYLAHGRGHVLGVRAKGRWTIDAPNSGFSSMEIRGYLRGQYLAEHSTFIEIDERYYLNQHWGLVAFTGIGCLYGKDLVGNYNNCSDSDNLYPSIGAGVSYALKPEEKIIVRAEVAAGKAGSYGFYLKFGQPF